MAGEDGIAQTVVHLHAAKLVIGHILLRGGDSFLDGESIEREGSLFSCHRRVAYDTLFGIIALFRHVGTLNQRDDRQSEVFGKGIVSAVVGRYGHDGTRSVAGQYIFRHPDGDGIARKGINGIRTGKDTRHLTVRHTIQLGTFLHIVQIFLYCLFLFGRGHLLYILAFRSQYHKGYAKHGIGTGGEDGEFHIAVFHRKLHFGTL